MWNPPIALTLEEQKIAARTRKARRFFVFLRERRHELLDADFQRTLARSYRPAPQGKAPVEVGLLALALLLQAYCNVGDRDAVELTVMDKRWQMVLDCLGTEQPPFSQGTLFNFRMRLIAHDLDKALLDRTVALAEKTGGFGARQLRAALDSTPLFGASRVEDTLNLLGHGLRKAVGLVAQARDTSADVLLEEAGLTLVGRSSLKAALDLRWGEPGARVQALRLVLEEVERWKRWLEQHQHLPEPESPLQEVMDTIAQIVAQDTELDPEGGPGGRRIKKQVAPDRRISIEDKDMRHGRKSSSKTFNGFKEHFVLDLDSKVTREVVVRPANEPEYEAVELVADVLESGQGLLQLDIDLGYMASPRMTQWAEQGVYIIARPWPHGGPLFSKADFTLDFPHGTVTCPNGQTVPMIPGRDVQFPASACDPCPVRAQCTKARIGQGRSLTIREDELFQQKLRAKLQTKRGRASLRKRTAVEHAISHQLAHQGRRARYKGLRKNQFDGRRHAAVSNLQVAAHYEEERQLAS
jgi:DDE family transposase/transposase-like protein DUF772